MAGSKEGPGQVVGDMEEETVDLQLAVGGLRTPEEAGPTGAEKTEEHGHMVSNGLPMPHGSPWVQGRGREQLAPTFGPTDFLNHL